MKGTQMKEILKFNKNIYSKEALLKAAYQFLDEVYIHLDEIEDYYIVEISEKDGNTINIKDFENEILIQQTRKQVADKTHKLRETIFARAMASTIIDENRNLDEEIEVSQDEILVDWFDKYDK